MTVMSMTGYGKGKGGLKGSKVECDLKSVNHRFLEVNVRMPKEYLSLESEIKELVSQKIKRGRLDLFITIDTGSTMVRTIDFDEKTAKRYMTTLKRMKKNLGLSGDISLEFLAAQPGVVNVSEKPEEIPVIGDLILKAVGQALMRLAVMRKSEGRAMAADIKRRCTNVKKLVAELEKSVPKVHRELKNKLLFRSKDLLEKVALDPDRLAQEVAFLMMKMDVSEELVRLKNHVDQIGISLKDGGRIGRKIDFLLQEANREVTTCGNKTQGLEVSALVVEIKSELEKMREQAQNVE